MGILQIPVGQLESLVPCKKSIGNCTCCRFAARLRGRFAGRVQREKWNNGKIDRGILIPGSQKYYYFLFICRTIVGLVILSSSAGSMALLSIIDKQPNPYILARQNTWWWAFLIMVHVVPYLVPPASQNVVDLFSRQRPCIR